MIIPALNEEAALPSTLAELAALDVTLDALVVDDGSRDRTPIVAAAGGAYVVSLPFNLGVGGAVRTGLRFARDRGYDRALIVDADGQHDPRAISDLLAALDSGADVAVGSRFAPGARSYPVSRVRRSAMRLLARIVQLLTGQRFTDVTSGFRAFGRRAIEPLARDYPTEYLADTVEVLLLCCAEGLRVTEVPIAMRVRAAGLPSNRNLRLVVSFLRVFVGLMGSAIFTPGRARRAPMAGAEVEEHAAPPPVHRASRRRAASNAGGSS